MEKAGRGVWRTSSRPQPMGVTWGAGGLSIHSGEGSTPSTSSKLLCGCGETGIRSRSGIGWRKRREGSIPSTRTMILQL